MALILLVAALALASCGQAAEAAEAEATDTAGDGTLCATFGTGDTSQPDEEPEASFIINDPRVEAIWIDQPLYLDADRETSAASPSNYFIAGRETAIIVTFTEPVEEVFSEGIPLCYISVYGEDRFLTQVAASGRYDGCDLYFQPKNIGETGNWAPGSYTFELYLGSEEETAAAVLTADLKGATGSFSSVTTPGREISESLKPPEIISSQTEIPELKIGEGIRFEAMVYDEQDGWLSGGEVLWSRGGRDYLKGSTLRVWPYELPPGTHTFTCKATNSAGLSSQKDFEFTVAEEEYELQDDRFREEIDSALSKGLILPLNRLAVPVSRGQYANLISGFYFDVSGAGKSYHDYISDDTKIFGRDGWNQSLMVRMGVMETIDGFFEPNKPLTEEEALLIMCRIVALSIPDFFGAEEESGIRLALVANGILDGYGLDAYQADRKLTQELALVRLGRLYDIVVHNKLHLIAESYELYKCDDAAFAMRASLIKSGESGSVVNLYFPEDSIVYTRDRENGLIKVSTTGIHVGVLYGGRIHCNVFPGGLPEKEWIESFFLTRERDPWVQYLPF